MSDFHDSSLPPAGVVSLSDNTLFRQYVTDADQQAFATLVRRHSGWVISTALRRCGRPELAQESAQNVFLALARKAPRLLSSPGLALWLHRAAVLETAALLRRESRYRQAMKRHQDESALHESGDGASDAWKAMRDQVDEALNSLSGADRDVLIRHHVEG